jgi:glyoxylase-like metal-dependent hydrolase (beta-lactamase superfamily II)
MNPNVLTLDAQFQNKQGIIAVYAIPHASGIILVDCGPSSTLSAIRAALAARGFAPQQVTDVLLTHIHLDHAGAAGWWAQQGARIHVHPVGAPHLANPEKLLASAQRIYGDDMERLWGAFLPVPPERLLPHQDNEVIAIGGRNLTAWNTPGHAEHHFAYCFEDVCFSGDVGGVRVGGLNHVRPPTPPPELDLEKWRASIQRLRDAKFRFIAPTHFGMYDDKDAHLDMLVRTLDKLEAWLVREMEHAPTQEQFRADFAALLEQLSRAEGYTRAQVAAYGDAAGSDMSADGVYRYWKKFRAP